MVRIGQFLFRYRNGLFPLFYGALFIPGPQVLKVDWLAALAGFLVALTGQSLRALTIGLDYIRRGGKKRQVYADRLVQGGVFAHCRNPLYAGNFLILAGVGLLSNSALFLAVVLPFFALAYWCIILAEEDYLRRQFGPEFDDYCRRVNRFFPDFRGWHQTVEGMTFNWRRLVSAEYGSTFIWLAAAVLVSLKNLWLHGGYPIGHPLVLGLVGVLVLVFVAYATARFLKKSGRFQTV